MTKIDIISGFLGSGKTTLIKKLLNEALKNEKTVIIENEFGEIGIDGGFLKQEGIIINEINSGCICCSLSGDFTKALGSVIKDYSPDRIIIEPSGVGKLSDVIAAVKTVLSDNVVLNSCATVCDANRFKIYHKNFGEFFDNQIEHAQTVFLSHINGISAEKLSFCCAEIAKINGNALISTTDWDELTGIQLLEALENGKALLEVNEHDKNCDCHEHHHEHDEHCDCHEHDEHCYCHEHEHEHEHDEHCDCHEHKHQHEHEHGENCSCGCHDHDHHHADEVFTSIGIQTARKFTKEELNSILSGLVDSGKYGNILRAKGIVNSVDNTWLHFDYVPGEPDIRTGSADVTGRLCVIGSGIDKDSLEILFK